MVRTFLLLGFFVTALNVSADPATKTDVIGKVWCFAVSKESSEKMQFFSTGDFTDDLSNSLGERHVQGTWEMPSPGKMIVHLDVDAKVYVTVEMADQRLSLTVAGQDSISANVCSN